MAELDLDKLAALVADMTPAPWHQSPSNVGGLDCQECPVMFAVRVPPEAEEPIAFWSRVDHEGVIALRNAAPELLRLARMGIQRSAEVASLLDLIEGKIDETFASGATMRRCRHCGDPVVGGPNACTGCVRQQDSLTERDTAIRERDEARQSAEQAWSEVALQWEQVRAAQAERDEARAEVERLRAALAEALDFAAGVNVASDLPRLFRNEALNVMRLRTLLPPSAHAPHCAYIDCGSDCDCGAVVAAAPESTDSGRYAPAPADPSDAERIASWLYGQLGAIDPIMTHDDGVKHALTCRIVEQIRAGAWRRP